MNIYLAVSIAAAIGLVAACTTYFNNLENDQLKARIEAIEKKVDK